MSNIGINPTQVFTAAELLQQGWGRGSIGQDGFNNVYVLCESVAAIAADGLVGFINGTYQFTAITTSNDAAGQRCGVSRGLPTASGQFFWAQVFGAGAIRVLASAAAATRLNTTGTAGALDDDGTAASFAVIGLSINAANGGATASAMGQISYPYTGAVAL